jgi:hypothetical protein
MLAFQTDRKKFDADHGGDGIAIDSMAYFSDGARRTISDIPEYYDPPADPYERAGLILLYHETVLERRTRDYRELYQNVQGQITAAIRERRHPARHLPGELRQMLKSVREAQAKVKAAQEARLAAEPEEFELRRQDEAEALAACADMQSEISSLKI